VEATAHEAPLYYNDKYDFALSRYDDVERCSVDWRTYISGKGSVVEIIKAGWRCHREHLFEDPPSHDMHARSSVVSSRRAIAEISRRCASSAHSGPT
jgi:hypothetical protein